MHVPTEEEFAAIAAAYTLVRADGASAVSPVTPGWRLAARVGSRDWAQLRAVSRVARWTVRGRLDE